MLDIINLTFVKRRQASSCRTTWRLDLDDVRTKVTQNLTTEETFSLR